MCNYMITKNRQCRNSKNSTFCHIHKPQLDTTQIISLYAKQDKDKKEIKELYEIISNNKKFYDTLYNKHIKNVDDHNLLLKTYDKSIELCLKQEDKINKLKQEIKNLNKTIEKKVNTIKDLTQFKESNKVKLELLNKVKEYELEKQQLINNNIDIIYYDDPDFHNRRLERNRLIHEELITI